MRAGVHNQAGATDAYAARSGDREHDHSVSVDNSQNSNDTSSW
jgi:hypothetical protein